MTLCEGEVTLPAGSDPCPSAGEYFGDWAATSPLLRELWPRIMAGESLSARIELPELVYEVWWTTAERSSDGEFAGGSGIVVNISAAVRAQRETERVHQAARALGEMRNDFVASVSHELRTPLTAIIGYGEVLQAHWAKYTDDERFSRVGKMLTAARRQKRLVEDLLLITRLDESLPAAGFVPVNIANTVQRVCGEAQGAYLGQHIDMDGPADLHALGDPDRVTQILANMVDNAAKYSPERSPVCVTWTQVGDVVVVRVHDEGSGIPEASQDRLFTRFGRIPGSQMRAGRVGTGLGLYVGRQLARAMRGDLELERTGASGSTFRLRLPIAAGRPETQMPRVARDDAYSDSVARRPVRRSDGSADDADDADGER